MKEHSMGFDRELRLAQEQNRSLLLTLREGNVS